MKAENELGRSLFPMAIAGCVGAVGLAAGEPTTSMSLVAKLISGLAINHASDYIPSLLKAVGSTHPSEPNADLDRVAKHALLAILHETLNDHGWKEADIKETVGQAGGAWDTSLFPEHRLDTEELLALLRAAKPLDPEVGLRLARHLLRGNSPVAWEPLGDAIRERFTHTYELLLRNDTRAYRAVMLYLQQHELQEICKVTDELDGNSASLERLNRAVERLAQPQPPLERYEHLSQTSGAWSVRPTDLQFKRRATRYFPRERLYKQIHQVFATADPLLILKVLGPAGIGKSRLAIELCDAFHAEHWLAGFMPRHGAWPDDWTPVRDTLIVVDYAGSKSVGGRPLFDWLTTLYAQVPQIRQARLRVRVVLLDRTDQSEAWVRWTRDELEVDLNSITHTVALEPIRGEFDVIVAEEFVRRTGNSPTHGEQLAIETMAARLRGQFRPLFALLVAATLADPGEKEAQRWSPELLVESILKSQLHQWEVAGIKNKHLDLLFQATLTQTSLQQPIDDLSVSLLASLCSLSDVVDSDLTITPIAPDLLGEFFVLMRLRGEAVVGSESGTMVAARSRAILDRNWSHENAGRFFGLLLQDYVSWVPAAGVNPAIAISERTLDNVKVGAFSDGLAYCCYATAWKRPHSRNWAEWISQVPAAIREETLSVVAVGLYNATLDEANSQARRGLEDRLEALHERHGHPPIVREQLAKALYNATVCETDPRVRRELAERVAVLHDAHGNESAVRHALAMSLFNATVGEPDPQVRRALAERLAVLHDAHGREPAVREQLAKALLNAAVVEPERQVRLAIADRLAKLHDAHGHEAVIRDRLARALHSAIVIEPDPRVRQTLVGRLAALHDAHGHEATIRERLAWALYSETVVEQDLETRRALTDRLASLHDTHGHEAVIRERLAKALYNSTVGEFDSNVLWLLVERLEVLHNAHGHEPAIREQLARALYNTAVVEHNPESRGRLEDRLAALLDEFGLEPAIADSFETAEVRKGTGLGLSAAYTILQEHGGQLRVEQSTGLSPSFVVYLPTNHPHKAYKQYNSQKWSEAAAAFQRSVEQVPNDALAWQRLGASRFSLKQFAEAAAAYQQFVTLIPASALGWHALGTSQIYLKQYSEAIKNLELAVQLSGGAGLGLYNLGCAYAFSGQKKKALDSLAKAIEAGYINEVNFLGDYDYLGRVMPLHPLGDNFNPERRASLRVMLQFPVAYRFDDSMSSSMTVNLSKGGIAIGARTPLESRAKGLVRCRLPGSKHDIEVVSHIAWSASHGRIGLRFEDVEPADQTVIDDCVDTELRHEATRNQLDTGG